MGIRELPEEEFALFEDEILKYKMMSSSAKSLQYTSHNHYITGYDKENLQISKDLQIIGWQDKPSKLRAGDEVFVYNSTDKKIESCFSVTSRSSNYSPVWRDEKKEDKVIYENRFDAIVSYDHLDVDLEEVRTTQPFRSGQDFSLLIRAKHPRNIDDPKYGEFLNLLLRRSSESQEEKRSWSFDIESTIDEILAKDTEKELAVDRDLIRRIIIHLKSGKNVILVGPPGVGKTDLARRIIRIVGKRVLGREAIEEAVASDEWSRFDIIGGIDFENKFQEGYVTKAVSERSWLLIDEFNRANMNKAFGEMFMAIEYGEVRLKPSERAKHTNSIHIPRSFRIICTMNDFDKNILLSELSYGLITRFAFVPVVADVPKEKEVVIRRIKADLDNDSLLYDECREQIDAYFDFINEVRKERNIGVRTSLDVIRFLVSSFSYDRSASKWKSLNSALCDYLLPQLDRLDSKTLHHTLTAAKAYLEDQSFEPFKSELTDLLQTLQRASGWLSKDGQ